VLIIDKIKNKWVKAPVAVKASSAYAFCSIFQRCLSFVTLPLFTRLLTTQQYGQLIVYQSWVGILSIFLTLNLAYGSFATAMVKFEHDRDGYISSVEGICVLLSILFFIVYLPLSNFWNRLFELPTSLMVLMVVELLATTSFQMWCGKKRFEFEYKAVICLTLLISLVSPVLAYVFVISYEDKGFARILGYALVTVVVGGFLFIHTAINGKKIINKGYWRFALGFNVPLLVYYVSQAIFNQSDRIMISHMIGTDKAAVYGVAYSLGVVLSFVLSAINGSYVPWYYEKIKNGHQKENRKVSLAISVFLAVLLSGVIWFAPEIIWIMAGEHYYEAVYVVPPVALSLLLLFYSQLFINVEFYYEKKEQLVKASIFAAILNVVLNWLFLPMFGYTVAAYTTLVSYVFFAWANYFAMKTVLSEQCIEDCAHDYKRLIFLFLGLCAFSIVGVVLYEYLFVRLFVFLVLFVLVCVYKNMLNIFFRQFRKNYEVD